MMRTSAVLSSLMLLVSVVACGDGGDDGMGNGGGGGGVDGGGEFGASCRLVDLVISVDGSSSMEEELDAMRTTVFPAFATRLAQIGTGLDNFRVATLDACPDPASYHTRGSGDECDFSSGEAWIDSTSPNLDDEFACVGDIYLGDVNCSGSNDDEQPASAIASSLERPYANGDNAGFLRNEALLVVIAITDEDETPTGDAETAEEIYERLTAAKGGDPRRMVFLGIGGGSDCSGAYGDADEAVKLREITDLFLGQGRGVWWDLCDGNLEDGLDAAFGVIETACNELPPVL